MPATVTCPSCHVTLKPKTPLPAGARIKCPKCQTAFVVLADEEAAPPVSAPAPKPAGPKSGIAKPAAPKPEPQPEDVPDEAEAADDAPDDAAPAGTAGGAGFKDKLKKVPMWGWIVGGVAVLFLMCGCCGVGSWIVEATMLGGSLLGGSNISLTTYNQIKRGMTEDEVKTVMGGGPAKTATEGGMKIESWTSGADFITVTFDKGGKAFNRVLHSESGALKADAMGF